MHIRNRYGKDGRMISNNEVITECPELSALLARIDMRIRNEQKTRAEKEAKALGMGSKKNN